MRCVCCSVQVLLLPWNEPTLQSHPFPLGGSVGQNLRKPIPNTPLTSMDRLTGQKLSKETTELIQTLEQMDLIDTYITFHPTD